MSLIDLAQADHEARALANLRPTVDGAELGVPGLDLLDDYIEAQVHGPLFLDRDVEAVVLDPCYRDCRIEEVARSLPCTVEWHPGFRLGVDELRRYPGYRSMGVVQLGSSLVRDGYLDAKLIGDAARTARYDERDLKQLWHYVARFGLPV